MRSEYGANRRRQLEGRAGEVYREFVLAGTVSTDDPRVARDHPDRPCLDLLVELGLLTLDSPLGGYVAVDPATAQSRIVAPMGQEAADLLAESTSWANTLAELGQAFRRTNIARSPILELRGYANINRYVDASVADATSELLTARPASGGLAEILQDALERDVRALRRGVSLRTLYQHSARRSQPVKEYVERVREHGAQVRTLDELFNRLVVVDRTLALVPSTEAAEVAIAIHQPSLVRYLADVFDRYWERARDFGDKEPDPQRTVADDVSNLTVRMLIEGQSDHASAKRVGVSPRTYAGYVAALKEQYGAQTRFQLGYAMGRLGPIGPEPDQDEGN